MSEPGAGGEPRPLTDDMLEVREDFEKGMSLVPPVSIALILICAAVYAKQAFQLLTASPELARETIFLPGEMSRAKVLAGEWWRLLSATWIHATPDHILGNMAALFILGMGCEHAFGGARTLTVYVLAGVAGSVAGMKHSEPSVGASGAIFGLLGLLASSLWINRHRLIVRDQRLPMVLLCWALYALLNGAWAPYVDNMAHAGGFVAGLIAGRVLVPRGAAPGKGALAAGLASAAALGFALWKIRHGLM